jgi:LemA protein
VVAVIWLLVLLGIVLLVGLLLVLLYNRLVQQRNRVDNSWAQVEVQLKRRWDLIPNLVESVKGYAAHERGTFEAVTQARARAQQAQTPAETAQAEGILGAALGRLFAVAEAYPELQADENFRQLQDELAGTENRIAVSRQVYNDTVLTYNNAIQTFPGVALAGPFGFATREFFETDETQREAPRVDFSPGAGTAAPSVEPPPTAVPPAAPPGPEAGGSSAPGGTS